MAKILSISAIAHDCGVAFIEDGIIKYAFEEERFRRVKGIFIQFLFPELSLQALEKETGVTPFDEDVIVVMPKAVINADAHIHDHCIINTGAVIEHDNLVWDYSHISPHATLTGNVTIHEGVHIGAAVTIIPGVEIGEWSIIGAGATVIHPVPSHSKAVGTPARIINRSLGVVKDIM